MRVGRARRIERIAQEVLGGLVTRHLVVESAHVKHRSFRPFRNTVQALRRKTDCSCARGYGVHCVPHGMDQVRVLR